MDIAQFIAEKQTQLRKLTDNISPADLILIKADLDRLQKIQELLSIPKYRLVFIGNPGSGKTTTICHYLNLLDDDLVDKPLSNIELFNVASGRTTAFEVHYQLGEQTMFRLYPMDMEQQEALLREYCEDEWGKAFPDSAKTTSDESPKEVSIELERMIRNMLGFHSPNELSEMLTQRYSHPDFASFLEDMRQRARLSERNRVSLLYDNSMPVKQWVKKTFDGINRGKIADVPIPERVDVFFNPLELHVIFPSNVSEVIDTRGFDGNEREDLKKYLEDDDTLPILIDRPEEAPGANQKKILSDWILGEQKDIIPRVSLFVKNRDDALSKVNEADGDPEKGEEIKREEIARAVRADHLHYIPENTLFLDSYAGIYAQKPLVKSKDKGKNGGAAVIKVCNEEERFENEYKITAHINAVIERFHQGLTREAVEIGDRTEELIAKISAPSQNKQYADFLLKAAHSLETLRDGLVGLTNDDGRIYKEFEDFADNFCRSFREYSKIRWNSAKKTVSMAGTWYKAHIYHELSSFVRRASKNILQPAKNQALHYLQEGDFEELSSFLESCCSKMDDDYIELLDQIEMNAHHIMVDAFTVETPDLDYDFDYSIRKYRDQRSWLRLQNVPSGPGYYNRLMDAFKTRIIRQGVDEDITDMVKEKTTAFFDRILEVLEQKKRSL